MSSSVVPGSGDEGFEGNSVAVLHSQLINVGKQISAIELKVQVIDQRNIKEDGVKEYSKEDMQEIARLVRQLVKLQTDKERLTKQLADEQLVSSITNNIVSSPGAVSDTSASASSSWMGSPQMYSPPYTSMFSPQSPQSPYQQMPMQMPVQMMPMQMMPMQAQAMPAQEPASPDTTSTSNASDSTTKKIVLN